jgi:hypothetical protein
MIMTKVLAMPCLTFNLSYNILVVVVILSFVRIRKEFAPHKIKNYSSGHVSETPPVTVKRGV